MKLDFSGPTMKGNKYFGRVKSVWLESFDELNAYWSRLTNTHTHAEHPGPFPMQTSAKWAEQKCDEMFEIV